MTSEPSWRNEPPAHRLRPLERLEPGALLIHEIYRSIQGESTFAGLPCTFVRLAVCHLRCGYCDTPHAFNQGQVMPLEEVLQQALATPDELVEITGGEPLLQPEVFPLMNRLADAGRTVLLETSGALDTAPVDPRVRIILDIKTPGSGEAAANHWPNLERVRPTDEVKFVVCDETDWLWSREVIQRHGLDRRCSVLISPAFGTVEPRQLAEWILQSRLAIRLQLQLHKLLWNPDARGV